MVQRTTRENIAEGKARQKGKPSRNRQIWGRISAGLISTILLLTMSATVWTEAAGLGVHRSFLTGYVQRSHPGIDRLERDRLIDIVLNQAPKLQLPANFKVDGKDVDRVLFLTAVIETESSFRAKSVSIADARGYMQLMPATALWISKKSGLPTPPERDLYQPEVNVPRGVAYLNHLIREMGDVRLACLAYNAGPGSVQRGYYEERYWWKIMTSYRRLNAESENNVWMLKDLLKVRNI